MKKQLSPATAGGIVVAVLLVLAIAAWKMLLPHTGTASAAQNEAMTQQYNQMMQQNKTGAQGQQYNNYQQMMKNQQQQH